MDASSSQGQPKLPRQLLEDEVEDPVACQRSPPMNDLAMPLQRELPALIHKAEEQLAGGTCTCGSCMPSR